MNQPAITKERVRELQVMAQGLYGTIVGLTDTPYEAITLITMLHLSMWLNNREEGFDPKEMLKDYVENFLLNLEANEAGGMQ